MRNWRRANARRSNERPRATRNKPRPSRWSAEPRHPLRAVRLGALRRKRSSVLSPGAKKLSFHAILGNDVSPALIAVSRENRLRRMARPAWSKNHQLSTVTSRASQFLAGCRVGLRRGIMSDARSHPHHPPRSRSTVRQLRGSLSRRRPSRYFYWDDIAGRRLRPDLADSATAKLAAQSLAREEQSD